MTYLEDPSWWFLVALAVGTAAAVSRTLWLAAGLSFMWMVDGRTAQARELRRPEREIQRISESIEEIDSTEGVNNGLQLLSDDAKGVLMYLHRLEQILDVD